jgi:anthranilate phosphoribosyltransferase
VKQALEDLLARRDLSAARAEELLEAMMAPETPQGLSGALLAALRAKGETADELRGFASAMRRLARKPRLPGSVATLDVVGTGGDGSGSLNLSTGAALLAAACGRPVVKHGNRSISSRSGSADVLEQLGFVLPPDEDEAVRRLEETGFTFLFAPYFHPAMAVLAPVRRSMGVRTIFNMLGPLTNPAEPPFGLLGAFSMGAARKMAESMSQLPIRRIFVVHGAYGWDEATPCGTFHLFDARPGSVRYETRRPADLGFDLCRPEELAGGDATENAARLREVFEGARGAHRDAVVLGAALALEAYGAPSFSEAREEVEEAIDCGAARRLLDGIARGQNGGD